MVGRGKEQTCDTIEINPKTQAEIPHTGADLWRHTSACRRLPIDHRPCAMRPRAGDSRHDRFRPDVPLAVLPRARSVGPLQQEENLVGAAGSRVRHRFSRMDHRPEHLSGEHNNAGRIVPEVNSARSGSQTWAGEEHQPDRPRIPSSSRSATLRGRSPLLGNSSWSSELRSRSG